MKRFVLLVFLLTVSVTLGACAPDRASASTGEDGLVEDQASFLAALEEAGASVEVADTIDQDFFAPQGNVLHVNGADVQVFEYESAEAMENDASQVAPDGGSIGTSMVMWVDAPHFYKTGRVIVLYVGSDPAMLDLLEEVLGSQFAGR